LERFLDCFRRRYATQYVLSSGMNNSSRGTGRRVTKLSRTAQTKLYYMYSDGNMQST
jgi:hypothetical protein